MKRHCFPTTTRQSITVKPVSGSDTPCFLAETLIAVTQTLASGADSTVSETDQLASETDTPVSETRQADSVTARSLSAGDCAGEFVVDNVNH